MVSARNPGSFWDTVGMVGVVIFLIEAIFLILSLSNGGLSYFVAQNSVIWKTVSSRTGIVVFGLAAVVGVVTWERKG